MSVYNEKKSKKEAARAAKIKQAEWESYAAHLSQWELDNTLDC